MRPLARLRLQAAVAIALLTPALPSTSARASEPSDPGLAMQLELSYRVAPGCMSAGQFLKLLAKHVSAGGGNRLRGARVLVLRREDGYELAMKFSGNPAMHLPPAPDCNGLLREAVLEAGMARAPVMVDEWADEFFMHAARSPSDPTPVAALPAAGESPAAFDETSSTAGLRNAALRTSLPTASPGSLRDGRAPSEPAKPRPPRYEVFAHVAVTDGVLPRLAVGAGLTLGARLGSARLRLSGTGWHAQHWAPWSNPRYPRAEVDLLSARLEACGPLFTAPLAEGEMSLLTCASAGGYRLALSASESYPDEASVGTAAFGARVGVAVSLSNLRIEAFGGVEMLLPGKALHYESAATDAGDPEGNGVSQLALRASVFGVHLRVGWALDTESFRSRPSPQWPAPPSPSQLAARSELDAED